MDIKPWTEAVRLHPDVESEETAVATYAIDLGALVAKDPNVPPTYRDAYSFFHATHLTSDMRRLIEEVYKRLSGKEGNRVLQLRSPFGGGKSHTLATLYYAVKNRKEMEKAIPETRDLPDVKDTRIAVFDGEKFDAISGREIDGKRVRTIWGYLAWQLGAYELIEEQDQKRVSPGGELVKRIIGDKPTLILLDEVSRYLERAMGEKIGESTLYRQALEFIQTLTTEVSGSKNACLVYSLQASAREFFGNVEILATLDHLASRVDAKREPIRGDEIFSVLRKRLLAELPSEDIANKIADIYVDAIKRNILSYVPSEAERREVEERIIKFRERFVKAYPFHPALIDLMRERWASIPEFQRTRGVLRFLAVVLRTLKSRNVRDYLVSATDIPMDDPEVRRAFFTEVGQREPYQAVLEADFTGVNATVKRIDKSFKDAGAPATRIATAILMFSFGGQPKMEGKEGEILPPGVTEHDLMLATVSPHLDSTMIKAVLKELVSKCLYIHYDGARYSFKTTPNVNKLLEDEAEGIRNDEIKNEIKNMLEKELSGKSAVIWPQNSKDIPDKVPAFQIAYLPIEFVYEKNKEKIGIEFLMQYGDKPRVYKNGLALAIPDKNQIEPLRRAVRYLIAVQRVKGKNKSLNLTEEQQEQLKEREKTEKASRDSSFRNLYNTVWLLNLEDGKPVLETREVGGRALQATNIHERLMELLMRVPPPKVFDSLTAKRLSDLIKIEEGIKTKDIIDTFFSSLDFPRIIDENVIKKAILKGVKDSLFGLTNKDKVQIVEGKPVVAKEHVIIGKEIPIEEIDLPSGYIVNSKIIPTEEKPEVPQIPEEETEKPEVPEVGKITQITYTLKVNRQQLYKCFNALGNLVEKTGELSLKIEAQTKEGIDTNWLRNAVEEPIEEAGVEIKKDMSAETQIEEK
ncbi:MAG: ATP-binding protein [Candidatus Marinimicrobia bacterium]|nr:ATP-binding protein [Candidatus Neomarinimicrobiota bacterium]